MVTSALHELQPIQAAAITSIPMDHCNAINQFWEHHIVHGALDPLIDHVLSTVSYSKVTRPNIINFRIRGIERSNPGEHCWEWIIQVKWFLSSDSSRTSNHVCDLDIVFTSRSGLWWTPRRFFLKFRSNISLGWVQTTRIKDRYYNTLDLAKRTITPKRYLLKPDSISNLKHTHYN